MTKLVALFPMRDLICRVEKRSAFHRLRTRQVKWAGRLRNLLPAITHALHLPLNNRGFLEQVASVAYWLSGAQDEIQLSKKYYGV